MLSAMRRLEEQDARDRTDGSPRERRLRQIPPEVGALLGTLILATRARDVVEIGTSGGYSTLWLALAVRDTGGRVTTFEVDDAKVGAREALVRRRRCRGPGRRATRRCS
jgi:predicted O-methyltransferase YrrM